MHNLFLGLFLPSYFHAPFEQFFTSPPVPQNPFIIKKSAVNSYLKMYVLCVACKVTELLISHYQGESPNKTDIRSNFVTAFFNFTILFHLPDVL